VTIEAAVLSRTAAGVIGILAIGTVLWDAFETVVLPRTVSRRLRVSRVYIRGTWVPWARIASRIKSNGRRERFLAVYGPLSLLGLTAVWALGLIVGFAALYWSLAASLSPNGAAAPFLDDLYSSGTTFFGLGDALPSGRRARVVIVAEAGTGFALLAIVIAYLPVLYQSFSRREVRLTLLDAWAGSPPSAAEVLRRLSSGDAMASLDAFLVEWEYWCSDVLESHISYPILAFFRSQHQRQSWVSALTTVLDVSALVMAGIEGVPTWQARVTFAIARHAAVDLTQVLHATPDPSADRLPADALERLRRTMEDAGLKASRTADADGRLLELRRSYEPYILGLATLVMMPPSEWWRSTPAKDNWQVSPRGGAHL
jgi:hypothetical protein